MNAIDKFIRDKQGRTVIFQSPNLPLIGWFVFMIASRITDAEQIRSGFAFLSSAFLFTWAYLEVTQGSSYFRRLLGAAVLMILVANSFM